MKKSNQNHNNVTQSGRPPAIIRRPGGNPIILALTKPGKRRIFIIAAAMLLVIILAIILGQMLKIMPETTQTTTSVMQDNAVLMRDVPASAVARGNSLIVGVSDAFQVINPLFSTGEGENDAVSLIFESLLQLGPDGELAGQLALSWNYNDETHGLSFLLRNDHTFRDGRAVAVSDVVFTYQCLLADSYDGPFQGRFSSIQSVAAGPADNEVVFQLDSSIEAPDLNLFTIGILKSDYYSSDMSLIYKMDEDGLQPEGSGAYALEACTAEQAVLSLREGYGGSIKTITIRKIDSEDKYPMLQSGEIDIVRNIWDVRMQSRAGNLAGYTLTPYATSVGSYFLVNPELVPANTIQLPSQRLAVLLCAAGRELSGLQQSALNDLAGRELTLYFFAGLDEKIGQANQAVAAEIAGRLNQGGLTVSVEGIDWPALAARASGGDYDILLLPATANNRLPEQTVILTDADQPSASAFVAEYKQQVCIISNRLAQITFNPFGHPLAVLTGTWTDRVENIIVLDQDGSYWQEVTP